ncbi:MAG: hypothetical protein BJ554DRAFT_1173 [Olpidium bornovanus]|uniref:DNA mismatch repair protein MSH3 n=1 Tax=Olpidium bornovanus TaxID=278681 RepID=A0A8H7ZSA5_9FUNG|nr:MAG: hypothetical protein BJ554DRAFT_1173 [Olpidium bornovanus]
MLGSPAAAGGAGGGGGGECCCSSDPSSMQGSKGGQAGPKAATTKSGQKKQTSLLGYFSRVPADKKGAGSGGGSTEAIPTVKRSRLDGGGDGIGASVETDQRSCDGEEDADVAPPKRRRMTRRRVVAADSSEDESCQEQTAVERSVSPVKPEGSPTKRAERFRYNPSRRGNRPDVSNPEDSAAVACNDEKRRRREKYARMFGNRFLDSPMRSQWNSADGNAGMEMIDETADGAPQSGNFHFVPNEKTGASEIGTFALAFNSIAKKPPYTPLENQVIEIKKKNRDVLLVWTFIVEVGYKFRFFGEDAQIASRSLNIMCILDRAGHFYSASIPVPRLMVHTKRLVQLGYKVGIVRQMETAALKATSDTKSQPFVRELTNLYTKGTFVDGTGFSCLLSKGRAFQAASNVLNCGLNVARRIRRYAVQPSTGDVIYDVFQDTHLRNELETRIMHIQPCELIIPPVRSVEVRSYKKERSGEPTLSQASEKVVDYLSRQGYGTSLGDTVRVERAEGFFLNGRDAFTLVSDFYAEGVAESAGNPKERERRARLPPHQVFLAVLLDGNHAFKREHARQPGDIPQPAGLHRQREPFVEPRLHSDPVWEAAAENLGRKTACGYQVGKSFSKHILSDVSMHVNVADSALNEREDAVEELVGGTDHHRAPVEKCRNLLKALPDVEKSLCRVHYGKCPPSELWQLLSAFVEIGDAFPAGADDVDGQGNSQSGSATYKDSFRSPLLRSIVAFLPKVKSDALRFLRMLQKGAALKGDKENLFNEEDERFAEIKKCKEFIGLPVQDIAAAEENLLQHLKDVRKQLKMPTLQYSTIAGTEYIFEVKHNVRPPVPKSWVKVSKYVGFHYYGVYSLLAAVALTVKNFSTKAAGRYHSPEILDRLPILQACREKLAFASDRAYRAFLSSVADCYELFRDATKRLATLDCLLSLATVARQPGYVKPEFVTDTRIEIHQGRHPMVERIIPEPFVPNDVVLDSNALRTMVITGPNMGGKKFAFCGHLLRLTAANISRPMGASDNMLKGESTFMVLTVSARAKELKETSDIMKQATARSLVILDELGRGTSTHDGVAIAHAVLRHFVINVCDAHPSDGRRLSCYAESDNSAGPDTHDITFLYRITAGVAHRSYGLNVARLAKLPPRILEVAKTKSEELEQIIRRRRGRPEAKAACRLLRLLGELFSNNNASEESRGARVLQELRLLLGEKPGDNATVESARQQVA